MLRGDTIRRGLLDRTASHPKIMKPASQPEKRRNREETRFRRHRDDPFERWIPWRSEDISSELISGFTPFRGIACNNRQREVDQGNPEWEGEKRRGGNEKKRRVSCGESWLDTIGQREIGV